MIARIVLGLLIIGGSQLINVQAGARAEPILAVIGIAGTIYGLYVILTAAKHR